MQLLIVQPKGLERSVAKPREVSKEKYYGRWFTLLGGVPPSSATAPILGIWKVMLVASGFTLLLALIYVGICMRRRIERSWALVGSVITLVLRWVSLPALPTSELGYF